MRPQGKVVKRCVMKPSGRQIDTAATAVRTPQLAAGERCATSQDCLQRAQWLQLLFTRGGEAMLVHELDGRIVEANVAACELLGYALEELRAMCLWDLATGRNRRGGMRED